MTVTMPSQIWSAAQSLFGRTGRIDGIDIRFDHVDDADSFRNELQKNMELHSVI